MPPPQQILDGLTTIANDWRSLATVWHVLLAALLLGLYQGWRPSTHRIGPMLVLPLACVSALAWASGNPLNGGVFAALSLTLVALTVSLASTPVRCGALWVVACGAVLVAFGSIYPHFVTVESWTSYLYLAPLGLLPCPTLSAVIGMSLILNGLGSRAWSAVLASAGIFYGVVGVSLLGVTIDAVLMAGAILLAGLAAFPPTVSSAQSPARPGAMAA